MPPSPLKEKLLIPGPVGALEALVECPVDGRGNRVAVICHPHPLYQGTMNNKVVHTLALAMNDLGLPSVRFNFRGVGNSDGSYAGGDGEAEDLRAVAHYVRQRWFGAELWLLGFSFGAVIVARMAVDLGATRLLTVAPAINILGPQLAQTPAMPWLVVHGDCDDVVPLAGVKEWVDGLFPAPRLVVLQGSGHFFHGQLTALRDAIITAWRSRSEMDRK